jgi:SpoVK/Ycf46/Vps4 family AAA+-type ATPase
VATGELVTELVRAHFAADPTRFSNLLNQLIATESRLGHVHVAQRLRELKAEAALDKRSAKATPIARAPRDLQRVLSLSYERTTLEDLVLPESVSRSLNQYILEQRAADRLASHGLHPRRRMLLHGPPGTGKTMTARALAGDLQLPLARVRLEVLFSRYLGETASALADIFEEASKTRGVYLFDEFDALGSSRSDQGDVGEIKRVVGTFLQLLDADDSESIFVAATNAPGALDLALFRRFDDVLEYHLPDPAAISRLISGLAHRLDVHFSSSQLGSLAERSVGLSLADVAAAFQDAYKTAVLADADAPSFAEIESAIRRRASQAADAVK